MQEIPLGELIVIQHQIFKEKINAIIARAGLPLAASIDPSISWGAFLEISNGDELPPQLYLKWRVHPLLRNEFKSVEPGRLLEDLKAKEYIAAERAMNDALVAIIENAGFNAQLAHGERIGQILITEAEPIRDDSARQRR
jgi:hypothetical protein